MTWEHGYRCHGLWVGDTRVAKVFIGPRLLWKPEDGYDWYTNVGGGSESGHARTLRQAKRAAEKAARRQLATVATKDTQGVKPWS